MKGFFAVLSFLLLAGCVQPQPMEQFSGFPEQTYLDLPKSGTGTVTGQVFLRTVGGDVKYGAGSPVLLLQETDYMRQFYSAWLDNKRAPVLDNRALYAGFKVQANGSGEFTFNNVPPGDYYVVSQVTWGAPTPYGVSNQGGSIMVRAIVANDSVTTVMVTK
jgi:hypothetical protein